MMDFLLYALFVILGHPVAVVVAQRVNGACRDNREEFGFALVGHDYREVHADHFGRCFFECSLEERCQSVTYIWNAKECKMNNETKKSRRQDFFQNPAATYMENTFRAKKGSTVSVPGYSCQDILISGDAQGDGEYWIDPTASGAPFRVFCGMTTDGGGWTLIYRFVMKNHESTSDPFHKSNSYRTILPNYKLNHQFLLRVGLNQLKIDIGFTQIRFYCFKKKPGRVFHITTSKNTEGANVVKFFTDSNVIPKACGSFTRFSDDNSTLATSCTAWGYPDSDRWGRKSYRTSDRLFLRPLFRPMDLYFRTLGGIPYSCDSKDEEMSLGDTWQIFVR